MMERQKHKAPRQLWLQGLRVNEKTLFFALCGSRRKRPRTNSTDHNSDMKQAREIMPEIRLNSNYSTCYKSALSVVHSKKWITAS